jgi:LysM repeat protein
MLTISAVVLLHLGVIAVLVGVNGCRTTTGFERTADLGAFSGTAGTAPGGLAAPAPVGGAGLNEAPAPVLPEARPVVQAAGPGGTHVVVKGESLYVIARREGITVAQLAAANGLELNALLRIGQKLTIPAKDSVAPAPKTGPAAPGAAPAAATSVIPRGGFGGFSGYGAETPTEPAQPAPAPAAPAPAQPAPAPANGIPPGGFGGFGEGSR